MDFVQMAGEWYVQCTYGSEGEIFDWTGGARVPMGEYSQIVSAGNIGWFAAKNNGTEYLLTPDGDVRKELSGVYVAVVADKYLIYQEPDPVTHSLRLFEYDSTDPASLDANSDNLQRTVQVYDLEENLLFERELSYIQWLGDGYCVQDSSGQSDTPRETVLYDDAGNPIADLDEYLEFWITILEYNADENTLLFTSNNPLYSGALSSYDSFCTYHLDTGAAEFTSIPGELISWNSQLVANQSGDFYTISDFNGNAVIEGRYADYEPEDDVLFLEDIDGAWGAIDASGEIVIPFGQISEGSDYGYNYNGAEMDYYDDMNYESDGLFVFATEEGGMYSVHVLPVK